MLDLGKFDPVAACNEGAEIEIKLDGMPPTGTVIKVRGIDSDAVRKLNDERIRRLQRDFKKTGKFNPTDPVDAARERIEFVIACTMGWRGVQIDGKEVPFSVEAARAVYEKHRWIVEQLDQAIGDLGNFIKA